MMSDELTPEQLAAIRARADAATPGPWEWALGDSNDPYHLYGAGKRDVLFPSAIRPLAIGTADRAFIAHARTDIPALLAEIDRLRAEYAVALHALSEPGR